MSYVEQEKRRVRSKEAENAISYFASLFNNFYINNGMNAKKFIIHPHAIIRMRERGITEEEISATIENGERFTAKYGRVGFRRNFHFESSWMGRFYNTKQVEIYAVDEGFQMVVITVIAKYF